MPRTALLFEPPVPTGPDARERLAERWEVLRTAAGLAADEPCLVALSGGADSVLLLHLVHAACTQRAAHESTDRSRLSRWVAVHVDHGLRGEESEGDAAFCARLCRELGVRFVRRRAPLEPDSPSLEARARELRYRALAEEARRAGIETLLTGHHADDALETLLLRWLRGSEPAGLTGLRARSPLAAVLDVGLEPETPAPTRLSVVRPLIGLRRAEIRAQLDELDLRWREDSSNTSRAFTRNRVRHELLPQLEREGGPNALANLRAFESSVHKLEEELAARTASLAWAPPPFGAALRPSKHAHLGGTLERARLCALPAPLRRRALWRLLCEGTGHAPGRALLDQLQRDLASGRCTRRSLPGDWSLQLRSKALHLEPPKSAIPPGPIAMDSGPDRSRQLNLPGLESAQVSPEATLRLPVGGSIELPDGRELRAHLAPASPGASVPRSPCRVELDAERLPAALRVRWARPGDRFHALGAPGAKRLSRFLADCGVPRGERERVPLVFAGDELVWVAGIRPAEAWRVRPGETRRRVRLELAGAAGHASLERPLEQPVERTC